LNETAQSSTGATIKEAVTALALETGFDRVGFALPSINESDRQNIRKFCDEKRYGDMEWFARHLAIRLEPKQIFEQAETVVALATSYRDLRAEEWIQNSPLKISCYATGRDYHKVLRKRTLLLLRRIQERFPDAEGRITVDSAPVPEKILARDAGLGWIGKHTNLIDPRDGSYFFISLLFLNLRIEPDAPQPDRCGNCMRCIDACPTAALRPYEIDATRCISYLTIETRSPVDPSLARNLDGWVFGCDLCQIACPYNGRTVSRRDANHPEFAMRGTLRDEMERIAERLLSGSSIPAAEAIAPEQYETVASGSAVRRIGYRKWVENIELAAAGRSGDRRV